MKKINLKKIICFCICFVLIMSFMIIGAFAADDCDHQGNVIDPTTYERTSSTTHLKKVQCGSCLEVLVSVSEECDFSSGMCVCGNCNHTGGSGISIPLAYSSASSTTHTVSTI